MIGLVFCFLDFYQAKVLVKVEAFLDKNSLSGKVSIYTALFP